MQPTLKDNKMMSNHRVLSFKPQLRPEWRGQDGQNETEQPDHSASLGDSITSSTQIRFSVHTGIQQYLSLIIDPAQHSVRPDDTKFTFDQRSIEHQFTEIAPRTAIIGMNSPNQFRV